MSYGKGLQCTVCTRTANIRNMPPTLIKSIKPRREQPVIDPVEVTGEHQHLQSRIVFISKRNSTHHSSTGSLFCGRRGHPCVRERCRSREMLAFIEHGNAPSHIRAIYSIFSSMWSHDAVCDFSLWTQKAADRSGVRFLLSSEVQFCVNQTVQLMNLVVRRCNIQNSTSVLSVVKFDVVNYCAVAYFHTSEALLFIFCYSIFSIMELELYIFWQARQDRAPHPLRCPTFLEIEPKI